MKKIICFMLFLVGCDVWAQNLAVANELSPTDFQKLEKRYLEMVESPSYLAVKSIGTEFRMKLNSHDYSFIEDEKKWSDWISANLSSTKFSSVEEADRIRKESIAAVIKNMDIFSDVFSGLTKASLDQRREILRSAQQKELKTTQAMFKALKQKAP